MKVNFAHVCDYAMVSQEGKLSVIGMFSRINTVKLPAKHPSMYLAFELELVPAELDRDFTIEIQLVDEDGQKIVAAQGSTRFTREAFASGGSVLPRIPHVLGFAGFPIKKVGRYSFNIFINNDHKGAAEFEVVQIAPPAGLLP